MSNSCDFFKTIRGRHPSYYNGDIYEGDWVNDKREVVPDVRCRAQQNRKRSQKMCTELLHLPQLLLCQPQRQETYLTRRTGGDCIRFPCPLPGVTSHIRQL